MTIEAGKFSAMVMTDGDPTWIHLSHKRSEFPVLSVSDLLDLQYVVNRAVAQVNCDREEKRLRELQALANKMERVQLRSS